MRHREIRVAVVGLVGGDFCDDRRGRGPLGAHEGGTVYIGRKDVPGRVRFVMSDMLAVTQDTGPFGVCLCVYLPWSG